MKKWKFLILMALVLCFSGLGCSSGSQENGSSFSIYYKEQNQYDLVAVPVVLTDTTSSFDALANTIYLEMKEVNDQLSYESPVPKGAELIGLTLEKGILSLNFSSSYLTLQDQDEVLFRAALTETFTQLSDVDLVTILVEGQPLTLSDGTVVGPAGGSHFLNMTDEGIGDYDEVTVTLFRSSLDGEKLISESRTFQYLKKNTAAWAALEKMLEEGDTGDSLSVFPENTRLLSVSVKDGLCVVDFNEAFLEGRTGIQPRVTIYAIVDTLTSLNNITSVEITVNGSSQILYMDQVDLSEPLSRNLDLMNE